MLTEEQRVNLTLTLSFLKEELKFFEERIKYYAESDSLTSEKHKNEVLQKSGKLASLARDRILQALSYLDNPNTKKKIETRSLFYALKIKLEDIIFYYSLEQRFYEIRNELIPAEGSDLPFTEKAIAQIKDAIANLDQPAPAPSQLNTNTLIIKEENQNQPIFIEMTEIIPPIQQLHEEPDPEDMQRKKMNSILHELLHVTMYAKNNCKSISSQVSFFYPQNIISVNNCCKETSKFLDSLIKNLESENTKMTAISWQSVQNYKNLMQSRIVAKIYNNQLLRGFINLLFLYQEKFQKLQLGHGLHEIDLVEKKNLFINRIDAFEISFKGHKISKKDPIFFKELREIIKKSNNFPADFSALKNSEKPEIATELEKIQKIRSIRADYLPQNHYIQFKEAILSHYIHTLKKELITHYDQKSEPIKDFLKNISKKIQDASSFKQLKRQLIEIKTHLLLMDVIAYEQEIADQKHSYLSHQNQKIALIWVNSLIGLLEQDPEKLLAAAPPLKVSHSSLLNTSPSSGAGGPSYFRSTY